MWGDQDPRNGKRHQHVVESRKLERILGNKLGEDLIFMLMEPTHEEHVAFDSDPIHVRGTGTLLMTKVGD